MRNHRIIFPCIFLTALIASVIAVPAQTRRKQTDSPTVRMVYLIPYDRDYRKDYEDGMKAAAQSTQLWYLLQTPGITFRLDKDVVQVVRLPHNAEWYSTAPNGDFWGWFWANVLGDAFQATGAQFSDPQHIWVFYIDADNGCGQGVGAGGGVVLVAANDLRGLAGEPFQPVCPWDFDEGKRCRWIGGLGHELGHTFNLPHPSEPMDDHAYWSLMYMGYTTYPDTWLLDWDKQILAQSPYLGPARVANSKQLNFSCDDKPVKPKVLGH